MVLEKTLPLKDDLRGKLKPNYEVTYIVTEVLPGGALIF